MLRGVGQSPFDASERVLLERVKTHVTVALETQKGLRLANRHLRIGAALLDQFKRPMLLIDSERVVRYSNGEAKQALEKSDFVSAKGGILRCRHASSDHALGLAIHELRLTTGLLLPVAPPDRRFVRVSTLTDITPIGIYLAALRPQATAGVFGTDPVALVFFHDPRSQTALDSLAIAETFETTPAEARVAIGLAQGMTLEDIAADRHVSLSTVRTQLRAVMSKANVNRQADPVRLLVAMPNLR